MVLENMESRKYTEIKIRDFVLKFDFAEMQPILREAKVVQGERKTKRKRSFQDLFFQAAAGL